MLATELLRIARADRRTRDYTFNTLRQALAEVVAPVYRRVYRTYDRGRRRAIARRTAATSTGRSRVRAGASRAADATIFDFVRSALLGRAPDDAHPAIAERVRRVRAAVSSSSPRR